MHKSQVFFWLLVSFLSGIFVASIFDVGQVFIYVGLIAAVGFIAIFGYQKSFNKKGLLVGFLLTAFLFGVVRFNSANLRQDTLDVFVDLKAGGKGVEVIVNGFVDDETIVKGNKAEIVLRAKELVARDRTIRIDDRIIITANSFPKFNYGDAVSATGMFQKPKNLTPSTGSGQADFIVHFHGTYIPAQGIPYIIEAARILDGKGVKFNMIGKLDTYGEAIDLAKQYNLTNVRFYDYMPYQKLAEFMANADICLGGFGDTEKAKMAGIFKIIEAMAMKKAFITADTPAMREFLVDRKDALFCRSADGQDLANKILELKNNPDLRNIIAENGYQLYLRRFTPKAIGRELITLINNI